MQDLKAALQDHSKDELLQVPVDDERVKLRQENGIWATDTFRAGQLLGEVL
eukprot:gene4691-4943_t